MQASTSVHCGRGLFVCPGSRRAQCPHPAGRRPRRTARAHHSCLAASTHRWQHLALGDLPGLLLGDTGDTSLSTGCVPQPQGLPGFPEASSFWADVSHFFLSPTGTPGLPVTFLSSLITTQDKTVSNLHLLGARCGDTASREQSPCPHLFPERYAPRDSHVQCHEEPAVCQAQEGLQGLPWPQAWTAPGPPPGAALTGSLLWQVHGALWTALAHLPECWPQVP